MDCKCQTTFIEPDRKVISLANTLKATWHECLYQNFIASRFDIFKHKHKCKPHGGVGGKVRWSPTSRLQHLGTKIVCTKFHAIL